MMRQFQVTYRFRGQTRIEEVRVARESRNEVTAMFAQDTQLDWFEVSKRGEPVVDWSKPNFNREEAAAYMGRSPEWIDEQAAKGLLPKARLGHPIYAREALDGLRSHMMQGDPLQKAAA